MATWVQDSSCLNRLNLSADGHEEFAELQPPTIFQMESWLSQHIRGKERACVLEKQQTEFDDLASSCVCVIYQPGDLEQASHVIPLSSSFFV